MSRNSFGIPQGHPGMRVIQWTGVEPSLPHVPATAVSGVPMRRLPPVCVLQQQRQEATSETGIHASQPGYATLGGRSQGLGVEQLRVVFRSRHAARSDRFRGVTEPSGPKEGAENPHISAKRGAPTRLPARSNLIHPGPPSNPAHPATGIGAGRSGSMKSVRRGRKAPRPPRRTRSNLGHPP
jgi:hypothetical protein